MVGWLWPRTYQSPQEELGIKIKKNIKNLQLKYLDFLFTIGSSLWLKYPPKNPTKFVGKNG